MKPAGSPNALPLLASLPLALLALAACGAPDEGRFEQHAIPGQDPWSADVTCASDADCFEGESCQDGVCQMRRCLGELTSTSPLGTFRYLGIDGEIAVVGDKHWVDGFESGGEYLSSLDFSDHGDIRDLTGGNFNGQRPQGVAVAVAGSTRVRLDQSDGESSLDVGFVPSDLAAGDVDRDGLDELIAFGEAGSIAICDVDRGTCRSAAIDGVAARDVTVGDVDGDGYFEPVFLYNVGDDEGLLVWNLDHETTGQDESRAWSLGFDAKEIDAGDPFGFGYDVIVIKHEGGWWDQVDDKLEIFSVESEQIVATRSIDGHTIDVAVGDRDGDDRDEIVTLRSDRNIDLYTSPGGTELQHVHKKAVGVGSSVQRLAMLDYDGDSPAGRLLAGPELVAGNPVPVTVMILPPYPHKVSDGPLSAQAMVGDSASTEETLSDTVSLHLGMTASFGLDAGPFKAKVSATLAKDISQTRAVGARLSVGARHSVHAEPDLYGSDYAAVVMSCGCFHKYRYETDDPAGKLGGSGKVAELLVPVGGQTQLWSSKRYNALAEAVGTLPRIEIPVRVGDPESYPSEPTTLEGEPVDPADMLFPELPSHQVSDVGFVGFFLVAGESETNESAVTTTVGMSAGLGAFGAGLDVEASLGVTRGYSIRVGAEAIFAGSVPPVPDDPSTPEDEYVAHRFSFTPFVYRQRYVDSGGEESGYYVMHYTQRPE